MIEVAHELRKAYIDALSGLILDGVSIPVYDSPVTGLVAEVRGARVYVHVTDQEEIETTDNRCGQKQDAFITLEVVAKFPKGRGGKLISELISSQIQQVVNSGVPLLIPSAKNALTRKELSFAREEHTETDSAFSKVLTFSNKITNN